MPKGLNFLVAGLGFGDEGKGSIVDAIVRQTKADLVVRYNGGAQCAHNVITPEGEHHTFVQFGSGTFVPGVRTYLSRFVLINPVSMLIEAETLSGKGIKDAFERTTVNGKAIIITPFQKALNRLQEESRGDSRHGSTGTGIGVTRGDHIEHGEAMLLAEDLPIKKRAEEKLQYIKQLCKVRAEVLDFKLVTSNVKRELELINSEKTIPWYLEKYDEWVRKIQLSWDPPVTKNVTVFEGGQGVLLDETFGFQPHTTWTDITYNNANTILKEMGQKSTFKIGVMRTYFTRHGAGPFPSENPELKNIPEMLEKHNTGKNYTGDFRLGNLDLPLLKYSLECLKGVDGLAINHVDVADALGTVPVRISETDTIDVPSSDLLLLIQDQLNVSPMILGFGPGYSNKCFSVEWSPKENVYIN